MTILSVCPPVCLPVHVYLSVCYYVSLVHVIATAKRIIELHHLLVP